MELDNTAKNTFSQCPRKYFYSFLCNLENEYGSSALRYGSTFHAMKEGFYKYVIENGWDDIPKAITQGASYGKKTWEEESQGRQFIEDYRTFENCLNSFLQSIDYYPLDRTTMELISSEQLFHAPIHLTNSQKKQFPYLTKVIFKGKIDGLVKLSGNPWILEIKTTGQPLNIQSQRLYRSSQLLGYSFIGNNYLDFYATGVLIDFHRLFSRRKKDGSFGKLTVEFERIPQVFTEKDINSWLEDFLYIANNISYCKKHNMWPQNTDSCFNYGPCQYLPLCERSLPLDIDYSDIPGFIIREKCYLNERK